MTWQDRCPVCFRTLAEAGPHIHGDEEIMRLYAPLLPEDLDDIAAKAAPIHGAPGFVVSLARSCERLVVEVRRLRRLLDGATSLNQAERELAEAVERELKPAHRESPRPIREIVSFDADGFTIHDGRLSPPVLVDRPAGPMTDQEIADVEHDANLDGDGGIACDRVRELVAEVRRLRAACWRIVEWCDRNQEHARRGEVRSLNMPRDLADGALGWQATPHAATPPADDWIEAAAREIAGAIGDGAMTEDVVALIRKHRDGRA